MKVHILAKELGIPSKHLLKELQDLGMEVTSLGSVLNEDQLALAREKFTPEPEPEPTPEPVAPAPVEDAAPPAEEEAVEETAPEEAAADTPDEAEAEGEDVAPEAPAGPRVIIWKGPLTVRELAAELELKPNQLIAELMMMNVFASINDKLDQKTAKALAEKHDCTVEKEKPAPKPKAPKPVKVTPKKKPKKKSASQAEAGKLPDEARPRPPIVTFMGHVDHGKTSLQDYIRKTRVAAGESGGITQHIGASQIEYNGRQVTFLDTPGHEAFTAMRARGANLTDIAVLVVAADDGIMPQTREAIAHAKAAGVAIIVAINKMDLPGANPDRVGQQLQTEGLMPEEWGGDTITCKVSAATGEGMEELMEMILLQADMLELQSNPSGPAHGFVIEAQLEPGMGPTASLLVRSGTLKVGDAVICGRFWGRIKALINDKGVKVRTAGPSQAVKCMGLTDVPEAGVEFEVVGSDKEAKTLSEQLIAEKKLADLAPPEEFSLDAFLAQTAGSTVAEELCLVIKADVQGSIEAIQQSLEGIESEKVNLKFVYVGVGNITRNDVLLAKASQAIVVGFHVGLENGVKPIARQEGVEIRLYSIIYELIEQVRDAMIGLLDPEVREKQQGEARVKQIFDIGRKSRVAGCEVVSGRIRARSRARVKRDGETVYEGRLSSLRRFQDDVNEVRMGQECGLRFDRFSGVEEGDVIETYEVEKITQGL